MTKLIRFVSHKTRDAQSNLEMFVDFVRTQFKPLLASNHFDDNVWSVEGLCGKLQQSKNIHFTLLGVIPKKNGWGYRRKNVLDQDYDGLFLRAPFLDFAKALLVYLHGWQPAVTISQRLSALRFLEAALYELNNSTCPTATTPEVLNRACGLAAESLSKATAYAVGIRLEVFYRYMVELRLVVVPSDWKCILQAPLMSRNRVGQQFDEERRKKLPSVLVLEALAAIFNSDSIDTKEIFASSVCALMLCCPDRSVEVLLAPLDIVGPDWCDPETGEVGTVLRWYPAKGAPPMSKTVVPSMREVAIRAINRLSQLGRPARSLARWYEQNPGRIYLPAHLEYLRGCKHLNQYEVYAILFGGQVRQITESELQRTFYWLNRKAVPHISKKGRRGGTRVNFADLEQAVLAELPAGFPVMDVKTGMRFSEALCLVRTGEFNSQASSPNQCCFGHVSYFSFYSMLKSKASSKSIFERRELRDESGNFLFLTSHMLRHYLNTLSRLSGEVTEEEIALWSGRKTVSQNATYNHQSDRDVIEKLRCALGDPAKSVGPFTNIDNRIFIRRDEFSSIKIITAHTTEFGYCVHDYSQSPCQVHKDCLHCNEQFCIKGDLRAEENLRKARVELMCLQEDARVAFSKEVLGAAEWFAYQTKTLERVNQLIAILDDPEVPLGSVIQMSGVIPPSRLAMAEETRNLHLKPVSQSINILDDVGVLLNGACCQSEKNNDVN